MNMKNTSVNFATAVLVLAGGLPMNALADTMVEVDMRFAGALATGVFHADPMTGTPVTSALIHVHTTGSLGRGVTQGFGAPDGDPVFTTSCLGSDGTFLSITATENPLVTTFEDLSLLFSNGSGEICLDLTTGKSVFRFDIMYTGGRGRFEGATGQAVIEGEAEPVSADGSFNGETGTQVGWVNLPFDDDDDDDDDDD